MNHHYQHHQPSRGRDDGNAAAGHDKPLPSTARSRLAQRMNLLRQYHQPSSAVHGQDNDSSSSLSSSSPSSPSLHPSPNRLPLQCTHRNNLPSCCKIGRNKHGDNNDKEMTNDKTPSTRPISSLSEETRQSLSDDADSLSPQKKKKKKKQFVRNDAAALVRHKLAAIRQPPGTASTSTSSNSSTAVATSREVGQRHPKPQGNKSKKSDKSVTIVAPSDSATMSTRQAELRKFLDMERLKRKHEHEMKAMLQRSIEGLDDEGDHDGSKGQLNMNMDGKGTNLFVEDECVSKETFSGKEVDKYVYEGPPDMDEEEPLYSTIRKKMSTIPRLSVGSKSCNVTTPSEPTFMDQTSVAANDPKQNTTTISSAVASQELSSLQSDTKMKHYPVVRTRGEMFSFFVPIEYGKEPTAPEDQPVPLIHLGTFTESAWLEFGDERVNVVGKARSLPFDVHVPKESKLNCYQLQVERVPTKKGFSLGLVCDDTFVHDDDEKEKNRFDSCTCFTVHRGQTKRLFVTWTPTVAGGLCETIYLKFPKGRVRVTVRGNARAKKDENAKKKTNRSAVSSLAVKKVAGGGTDEDKKKFSYLPSHRHFVSTSNAERSWGKYNDHRAAQQDETYKIWLNHVFKSPEMHDSEQSSDVTLRAMLSQRRRVQAMQRAQSYLRTPEVQWMKYTIDNEVHLKRLTIRTDHDVFANVNLRSQLISLLMSYTAPWLKIGLETIFGESITVDHFCPRDGDKEQSIYPKKETLTMVLRRFIVERVLSDPWLKMKYTKGKCNIPSGRFERMYKNDLNAHTLRKTLTLIIFLDGAKRNNVLPSSIRLFRKNGAVKSSKDFLHILCRDYIHGIGNLNKHLLQLGVSVSFEQSPLEELDFFVTNLATDLRDGVRLGKLAEVLGDSTGVIEQMRIPAISRLQKVFNVGVALSALSDLGVPNVDQVHPNYIVDGHRPQVLKILWSITSSFQMNNLLDKEKLREEIYAIRRSKKVSKGPLQFSSLCGDIESCQDICDLLLVWCDAVCSSYNLNIKNFTESFADGRAVCLLIHYYHPTMLKFSDILPTHISLEKDAAAIDDATRERLFRNERSNSLLASQKMTEIGGIPTNMLPISDTSNTPEERTMIICVSYLCARLLESSLESNAILVIQNAIRLYLNRSKLNQRRHAVHVIETAWFTYRSAYFKRQRALYINSVRKIEAFFISKRTIFDRISRQRFCVTQLQKVARGYIARKVHQQIISQRRAVISIQKAVRGYLKRKLFIAYKKSLVRIQSFTRMILSRREASLRFRSIATIQSASHNWLSSRKKSRIIFDTIDNSILQRPDDGYHLCWEEELDDSPRIKEHEIFDSFNSHRQYAAICIQSFWRRHNKSVTHSGNRYADEDLVAKNNAAAKIIQKAWLLHQKKRENRLSSKNTEARCAFVIQSAYRRYKFQERFSMLTIYATIIQKWYKSQIQIKRNNAVHFYATLIQANWRRFYATLQYRFDLSDIVFTQSLVRQRLAKARFKRSRYAIILLQSVVRRWLVKKKFRQEVRPESSSASGEDHSIYSAIVLQSYWRRYVAYMDFHIYRNAAITLQKFVRSRNTKLKQKEIYGHLSISSKAKDSESTHVQSIWQESTSDIDINFAASELQRIWRGYNTRLDFLLLLAATKKIQGFYRRKRSSLMKTEHHAEHNPSEKSEKTPSISSLALQEDKMSSESNTTADFKFTKIERFGIEGSNCAFTNLNLHLTGGAFQSGVSHNNDEVLFFDHLVDTKPSTSISINSKDNVHVDRFEQQPPMTILEENVDLTSESSQKMQLASLRHKRERPYQSQEGAIDASNNGSKDCPSRQNAKHMSEYVLPLRAVDVSSKENVVVDRSKRQTPKVVVENTAEKTRASDEKVQLASSNHKREKSKESQDAAIQESIYSSGHSVSLENCSSENFSPSRAITVVRNVDRLTKAVAEENVYRPRLSDKKMQLNSSERRSDRLHQSQKGAAKVSSKPSKDCPSDGSNVPGIVIPSKAVEVISKENVDVNRTKQHTPGALVKDNVDGPPSEKKLKIKSSNRKKERSKKSQDGAFIVSSNAYKDCPVQEKIDVGRCKQQTTKGVLEENVEKTSTSEERAQQRPSNRKKERSWRSQESTVKVSSNVSKDSPLLHNESHALGRIGTFRVVDNSGQEETKAVVEETMDMPPASSQKAQLILSIDKPESPKQSESSKQSQEVAVEVSKKSLPLSVRSKKFPSLDRESNLSGPVVSSRSVDVACSKEISHADRPKQHKFESTSSDKLSSRGNSTIKPAISMEPNRLSNDYSSVSTIENIEGQARKSCTHNSTSQFMNKSTIGSSGKADRLLGPRTKEALQALKSRGSFQEVMKAMRILEYATKLSLSSRKAFANAGAQSILHDLMRSCNRSAPHLELLECILGTLFNVSKNRDLVPHITTESSVNTFIDIIQMFRDKDRVFSTASMVLKRIIWSDAKHLSKCRNKENVKRIVGVYKLLKVERQAVSSTKERQCQTDYDLMKSGIRTLSRILEKCVSKD